MTRAPFKGNWLNAIDDKGRVSLPAEFRKVIDQRAAAAGRAGELSISIRKHPSDPCLQAFDPIFEGEFGARQERAAEDDDEMMFSRGRNGFGGLMPVSYDANGRMVIGSVQRGLVGIDGQAFFVGANYTFEIWNPETARHFLAEAAPDIAEHLEALIKDRKPGR